ncbi:MAG TPA: hypothetical protein VIB79_17830 [Candidatus Binatia bacterium]|jgi:hypothetical protein
MERNSRFVNDRIRRVVGSLGLLGAILFACVPAQAVLTPKQLEAFSARVGRTFWTKSADNRKPVFLSRPAAGAPSFPAPADESFVITELVAQNTSTPYYKVRFQSDKEGYITPEAFHEELNLTILTVEPDADQKRKAAQAAEQEKQRQDWIAAQPWSEPVKQAALNRRAVPGMTPQEVRKVLGEPSRVIKSRNARLNLAEERWLYVDGAELWFQNNILIRVVRKEKPAEESSADSK